LLLGILFRIELLVFTGAIIYVTFLLIHLREIYILAKHYEDEPLYPDTDNRADLQENSDTKKENPIMNLLIYIVAAIPFVGIILMIYSSHLLVWITALTGLIGSIAGLVAVLLRKG
jgi:hypothetical protein